MDKERIKNWLSVNKNLAFLGILIFAIIIRFYYFILTKNQPLWWDEAGYMAAAKNYAGIGNYQLEAIRLPGFSLLMSLPFIIGITSEPLIRFLALFIPSIILIILTYLMIKEMYPDSRIALISTAIITVLWEHLFYSNRFHTENFALIFQFLAMFILFKVYMKKKDLWFIKPKYSLVWIALLSIISVLFRPGNLMFIPAIILFIAVLNKDKLLKGKGLIFSISVILIAALCLIFSSRIPILNTMISVYYAPENPIAWNTLSIFYGFYQSVISWLPSLFFYCFLFGILVVLFDFFISFNKIKRIENNPEDLEIKSDMFNILLIIVVMFSFMFLLRTSWGYEYRWFFPLLPGMLVFTGKGIIVLSDYIGDMLNSKKLAVFLIFIVLVLGVYNQAVISDRLIKNKVESYSQVKESGLWMKENSNPDDIIISASVPQHAYYAERKIEDFYVNGSNENETAFNQKIQELKPHYLVISSFQPGFQPEWAYTWPQRNNQTAIPVQVYFIDEQQKQPVLIVYELNMEN